MEKGQWQVACLGREAASPPESLGWIAAQHHNIHGNVSGAVSPLSTDLCSDHHGDECSFIINAEVRSPCLQNHIIASN